LNAYSVGIVISGERAIRYSQDRECFYIDGIPKQIKDKAWSHIMLCKHIEY